MSQLRNTPKRLNPVSLPFGMIAQAYPEFSITGSIFLDMSRLYNAVGKAPSPLGPGNTTELDITITDDPNAEGYLLTTVEGLSVPFERPRPQLFSRSGNSGFRHLSLEPLSRGGLRLNDGKISRDFKRFAGRIWRVVKIFDLNGNTIEMTRDADGCLLDLAHPDGLRVAFHNEGPLRTGYDIVGLDDSVLPAVRYGYDAAGRMIAAKNPFGESWAFSYDASGNRTGSDNGAATRAVHHFDAQGRVVAVDTGGTYKHGQISYPEGKGPVTVSHGPDGTQFEKLWFDDQGRHFMTADPMGHLSYRKYNDQNDLIAEVDANGFNKTYEMDRHGSLQSFLDEEGRETFMVWDDLGNLMSLTDHAGNSTDYTYDEKGNLEQIRSAAGHVTNMRFNEAGLLAQTMRHDGLMEVRSYDAYNRLVSVSDFNSAETTFAYDAFGRMVAITDAAGHKTEMRYEGGPFATPSCVIRADGVTTRRSFNAAGVVETVTDGEGRATSYHYGPYNVLEQITDPKGGALRFSYNSQEQLTHVTNQTGLRWTFERDLAGRIVAETDFDGRTLRYRHDDGGRIIRRDNPDGAWLEYDYDKSGKLLEMRAFAEKGCDPLVTQYAYDNNGDLISAENADAAIEIGRDALGRVVAETVNDITIESEIDCCGRRVARRFADQSVKLDYDGMAGLTRWELAGHTPLRFDRDQLGQETNRSNGKGFALTQSWDAVGQLALQQAGENIERRYDWSRAYEPMVITDNATGPKRYDYDANGQILRTMHGDGAAEGFAYTADLNLAASSGSDTDRFTHWQTSAAGVVKLARGPKGEAVTLEHDACGRVIQRTVARDGFRPQTWQFEWNAQDQMTRAHCPDGDVWSYAYDPFGRRVSKSCAHTTVTFIWDGDVIAREITQSRGGTSTVDWFFEPGTFRPMARLENGLLSYVINDHLGTPKEILGGDGSLLWSTDHDTWGSLRLGRSGDGSGSVETGDYWIEATSVEGNTAQAYAPDPEASFCPIRFQGQWEDAETGLFYNRARYYDAVSATYQSPDPIGLLGGLRPQHYIANPSKYFDPMGLRAWSPLGSGICIVQKFPAGSAAADELASFVGQWNNEIIARGGSMTAGPLTDLQQSISDRWKRDFRRRECCASGQVAGHVPDAASGGLPNPSNGGLLQRADTNSYLGGITGDMSRRGQSYTWVHLRDQC